MVLLLGLSTNSRIPKQSSTFKEETNVKTNKLMALVLAAVMVLSLIPAAAGEAAPSLDFEDGSAGFVAVYEGMANSAAATLEVVDYNGSKALKVTNDNGKVPYVAFDVVSLLERGANGGIEVRHLLNLLRPCPLHLFAHISQIVVEGMQYALQLLAVAVELFAVRRLQLFAALFEHLLSDIQ